MPIYRCVNRQPRWLSTNLNMLIEAELMIVQQQQQIDTLTAGLKVQGAEIENASARVDMNKLAAKVVANKP